MEERGDETISDQRCIRVGTDIDTTVVVSYDPNSRRHTNTCMLTTL